MGAGSASLEFIRNWFTRENIFKQPDLPIVSSSNYFGQVGTFGFDYGQQAGMVGYGDFLRLEADLVARYVDYEDQDDSPLIACVTGDTVVRTVKGPVTIKELCEKYPNGEKFLVYAYDIASGKFVVAEAHHPRKTKEDDVYKVVLDSGEVIRCTKDHKFLTWNDEWVEAQNLVPGTSLIPMTTKINCKGYMEVTHPKCSYSKSKNRNESLYRLVARFIYGEFTNKDVHHKDENKLNDNLENLEILSKKEHIRIHSPMGANESRKVKWSYNRRQQYSDRMKGNSLRKGVKWTEAEYEVRKNLEFKPRKHAGQSIESVLNTVRNSLFISEASKKLGMNWSTVCRWLKRNGYDYNKEVAKNLNNHKVVSVEYCGIESVYDLTTDIYHNFVANGIVVHNSAFDIYADDAAQPDSMHHKSVWIEADDEDIRKELDDNLFQKRLRIDENIWEHARSLAKYGNLFLEKVIKDGEGVLALNYLPPPTVRRIEIENATLGYIYDPKGVFKITTSEFFDNLRTKNEQAILSQAYKPFSMQVFEGWEVTHMRLRGKNPRSIYGFSIGEPARWLYKRLVLLEDSIVMHRLTRAPSRYVFYVDVSNIPPNETKAYLSRIKQLVKKSRYVSPLTTGNQIDMRYQPLNPDDDFYLPVRDGREGTRVESLSGPIYDHIEDIKYFEDKLFAALKIPRPYMGYEETTAKSHLAAEDARFARTVMRVQREMRSQYKRICEIHMAAKSINPEQVNFDVVMTIPSAIFELSQLEVRSLEAELADKLSAFAPKYWILTNVFGFSDDQIKEMERMRHREAEIEAEFEKEMNAKGIEAEPGKAKEAKARRKMSSDQFLMGGIKKNTDALLEKMDDLRQKDKMFDRKIRRIEGFMKDFQGTFSNHRRK